LTIAERESAVLREARAEDLLPVVEYRQDVSRRDPGSAVP
jgi:hypothetical protein